MTPSKHGFAPECKPNCDYSKAVLKGRATWCCAKCGRDFSLEYLFWYEAVHGGLI